MEKLSNKKKSEEFLVIICKINLLKYILMILLINYQKKLIINILRLN